MKANMYTVYDSKTQAYLQPFQARTRGEAIRSFTEAVNDQKTMFYKYPSDYTLFELGEWDDEDGKITMLEAKTNIGLATHFKRVEDTEND